MNLDSINDYLSFLDKVQGLPGIGLVFLTCIICGYILRFFQRFPNDAIPLVVILWGGLFMLLIADARPTSMPAHVWTVRNLLVGLIVGFVAWIAHKIVLSRLEDKLFPPAPTPQPNPPLPGAQPKQ